MSKREFPHTPIPILRGLNILLKRDIELIKPGLLKRAVGMNEQGELQYELQPNRKTRRMLAARARRRKK